MQPFQRPDIESDSSLIEEVSHTTSPKRSPSRPTVPMGRGLFLLKENGLLKF